MNFYREDLMQKTINFGYVCIGGGGCHLRCQSLKLDKPVVFHKGVQWGGGQVSACKIPVTLIDQHPVLEQSRHK